MSPQKGKKSGCRPPGRKPTLPSEPGRSRGDDVAAAADYLHCHRATIYRLARLGSIPSFMLGGEWRFLKSDLDLWMAKGGNRR
jgi:excisionase family DNA binding protein